MARGAHADILGQGHNPQPRVIDESQGLERFCIRPVNDHDDFDLAQALTQRTGAAPITGWGRLMVVMTTEINGSDGLIHTAIGKIGKGLSAEGF